MYKKTGLIAVLDFEATVIKSDTAVPSELRDALFKHAYTLEDVPEQQKDWFVEAEFVVALYASFNPIVS